jgi:hypothetical protein
MTATPDIISPQDAPAVSGSDHRLVPPVAVLFARGDSIYKAMPGCDVYDMERDARRYRGDMPVVAHPPCRAWGALRHMAKPRPDEKRLALWAVLQVRLWGGVLEHPAGSMLWPEAKLPEVGERDAWGGFTIIIPQFWFGHLADKATRLYICGCEPNELPPVPYVLGEAPRTMAGVRKHQLAAGRKPELLKSDREKTPPAFAAWLVELARRCWGNEGGQP